MRAGLARRKLDLAELGRVAGFAPAEAPARRGSQTLLGFAGGKVRWIAVLDPRRVGAGALPTVLRRLLAEPGRG